MGDTLSLTSNSSTTTPNENMDKYLEKLQFVQRFEDRNFG
jgi:hypothetical protein